MTDNVPAYGLWGLTIVNAAIVIMFAFSVFRPRTRSDGRTFGTFPAFMPAVLTVTMFPVLVTMYVRLAHREERDMAAEFGEAWDRYASVTPGWWPRRLPGRDVRAGRAGAA